MLSRTFSAAGLGALLFSTLALAQSVDSFTLVNAATAADIRVLADGGTINLATDGASLNVRAETTPATVGSVRFGLDGNANFRTESTAPYALGGDTSGDYNAWTLAVERGFPIRRFFELGRALDISQERLAKVIALPVRPAAPPGAKAAAEMR